MRDPSWMQLSAQYRKAPPPPAGASESLQAAPAPASGPDGDPPYLAAWLSYRRRLRYIWINGVLGFLGIAALVAILPRVNGGETVLSALFPIWAMAWFAGMVIGMLRLVGFSCPRCGQTFFNPLVPPMSQLKCRGCGLRKLHVDDHGTPLYRLLWARRRAGE